MNAHVMNLACIISLFVTTVAFADDYPSPGMTMRTNSAACIAKHKSTHDLLAAYFNGVPAMSTLKRIDILTGGVTVNNATSAMPTGKLKTQLYAIASTYGSDPIGTITGKQSISEDYYSSEWMAFSTIRLVNNSGITVRIETNSDNCDSATLAKQLTININKKFDQNGLTFFGNVQLYFDTRNNYKICSDPTKKLLDFFIDEKNRLAAIPLIELRNSITFDSIDTEEKLVAVAESLANTEYNSGFSNNYNVSNGGNIYLSVWSESWPRQEYIANYSNMTLEEKKKDVRNKLREFVYYRKVQNATNTFATELSNSTIFKDVTVGSICAKAK